jgi:YD repeat-containing protein
MQQVVTEQTIDYTYDPLNRLTGESYDDGSSYAYTYDAVGNRLTENANDEINQYTYDEANRLDSVNGQAYTYDANGNLLADGAKTYTYNYANRLTQVVSGADTYQYNYNGLGDRLQSLLNGTATTYSLDLNSGLTQALADGSNTYTYGLNRIAQVSETQTGYFLGDAPRCAPIWCG